MATLAIVLNTTCKLDNDQYSAALRVTHDRKPKYFSINSLVTNGSFSFTCHKEQWRPAEKEDRGLGKFRKSVEGYKELNEVLEAKLKRAQEILTNYDILTIPFSFERFEQDLKEMYRIIQKVDEPIRKVTEEVSTPTVLLYDYYTEQIKILDEQQRAGMSGLYLENQRILHKFRPDALLTDVNFRFLESFEYWMRNVRGNKDTTISVKMRNLQRVINQAIEDKLFKQDEYPFGTKRYSVNKRLDHTTSKIAIHTDKVSRLKALQLEPGSALHFAQQIFLFSYYCRGMNFIDITFLKWGDVPEQTINYVRKKTRGKFNIPLNNYTTAILKYYRKYYQIPGGYVFPILNEDVHLTVKQKYTSEKWARQKYKTLRGHKVRASDWLKRLASVEPNLFAHWKIGVRP
jgi:integrase